MPSFTSTTPSHFSENVSVPLEDVARAISFPCGEPGAGWRRCVGTRGARRAQRSPLCHAQQPCHVGQLQKWPRFAGLKVALHCGWSWAAMNPVYDFHWVVGLKCQGSLCEVCWNGELQYPFHTGQRDCFHDVQNFSLCWVKLEYNSGSSSVLLHLLLLRKVQILQFVSRNKFS